MVVLYETIKLVKPEGLQGKRLTDDMIDLTKCEEIGYTYGSVYEGKFACFCIL